MKNSIITGATMGPSRIPSDVVSTTSAIKAYNDREGAPSSTAAPAAKSSGTQTAVERNLSTPSSQASITQVHKSSSLYVGDLHENFDEQALMELFQGHGPVQSIRICRDLITRASLKYGYVNFMNVDDAERAMEELNFHCSARTMNKAIRISWKQRDPSVRRSGRGNMFVKGLDKKITNRELFDTFKQFGRVMSSKVAMDDHGNSRGYGFVHYESPDSAKQAIMKVNGMMILNKKVFVGPFMNRFERSSSSKTSFTNIYVKDIEDSRLTEAKLRELFSVYGKITSVYIPHYADDSPKGFAFINFASSQNAKQAVAEMNGKLLDGKAAYVDRAQKRSERDAELRTKHNRLRREQEEKREGRNLYVKNLCKDVDEEDLKQRFGEYGSIESCVVIRDQAKISRGFGFVCFTSPNDAVKAKMALNGAALGTSEKVLYVAMAQRKEDRRVGVRTRFSPTPIQPKALMSTRWYDPRVGPSFFPSHQSTMPSYTMGSQNDNRTSAMMPMFNQPNMHPNWMPAVSYSYTHSFPQSCPVAPAPSCVAPEPLSIEKVTAAKAVDRKQMLGELLYPKVSSYNAELAGKITGMLLELDESEIVDILNSPTELEERMDEALSVLGVET